MTSPAEDHAPPLRIANCSGFYGDRFSAMREMLTGGPIDVITGDYLAELTMSILRKTALRRTDGGYARTFLRQLEECLGEIADRGVRVVVNAGGHAPAQLADEVRALAERLSVSVPVAHVQGDDVLDRLAEIDPATLRHLDTGQTLADAGATLVSANAYLGSGGIAAALEAGAQIVVCPRVTDAALVVGPARAHFGWAADAYDELAAAVVVGHLIECGPQVTGGNFAFFQELPDPAKLPGFPFAEISVDGTAVISKHPGTGGAVTVETVTAQLLYEINGPSYLNPDVTSHFDTVRLTQLAPDRVEVSGVRGTAPPPELKLCATYEGGYRNTMTVVLTEPAIEAKAASFRAMLASAWDVADQAETQVRLERIADDGTGAQSAATALLTVSVKGPDPDVVGRRFSGAVVETGLSTYPGMYMTSPPQAAAAFDVLWPTLVPRSLVDEEAVLEDGRRIAVSPPAQSAEAPDDPGIEPVAPDPSTKDCRRTVLGSLIGARSGDKGGNANLGVWARDDPTWAWLRATLTTDLLRELLPDVGELPIRRYELPLVRAINFVIVGLLGDGVSSSLRLDPQAKALGELLRSREVDIPIALLESRERMLGR